MKELTTRIQLIGLWISLILLYLYADLFSFYRPGYLKTMMAGFMGSLVVNQGTLTLSSILMVLPILMIIMTLSLREKMIYYLNCGVASLYTLINISNLIGETWLYYLLFGAIEIVFTGLIVKKAFKELRKSNA